MSETPKRGDLENDLIRRHAYELWEQAGKPTGSSSVHWLDAEAKLQAGSIISRRPITLPLLLTFTTIDDPYRRTQGKFQAPMPLPSWSSIPDEPPTLVEVSATYRGDLAPTKGLLRPEMLAHEARLVTVQMVAAGAAMDRFARFADWCSDPQDSPHSYIAPNVSTKTG